ncbi:MAG: pirin family protein [Burkholderiales bacterium]
MKTITSIHRSTDAHWVGDGFPVRTVFNYQNASLSPFLLLDYAGPADFDPSEEAHGVDWHPHRGFETVTIAYQGEVEHEDSAGNRGRIGPGDVQWMTAGAGVLHKEMHGREFARRGGKFEMVQLWVNLPAKFKMTEPRYQTLLARDIPEVSVAGGGRLRVIAGEFDGTKGPARTFTPVNLWDLRLGAGRRAELRVPEGYTTALFVLKGKALINASESAGEAELVLFERAGDAIAVEAEADATVLLLNGQAIDEPVIGHGPFVMNTQQEIRQAIVDYQNGTLGRIPSLAQ